MIWQLDNNNIPKVCAYVSVATTPAQQSWTPFNLELHAISIILKTFESLLLHQQINIFTDNAVCVQLNKYRPISAREKRLIAYLSQFQLNIRYLKGTRNYTADCLSRIMDDMNEIEIER